MTAVARGLYRELVARWARLGPRFLPFADAATPDLPLSRLLRLSLFQVSVGMALVLLVGTLNRVMIVELGVPAALVAVMVALPVLYAPLRALIGFRSDTHRSALGWRRVPFIWMGTLIQFGGLAVMPFALLVLSGGGNRSQWPAWIGQLGAGFCFLLVGAGLHTTQTAGLALATDLAPARVAAARGGPDVRDAAGRHDGQRLRVRRDAARLQPRPPGAGDPGRGGGDDGAQHRRAVEAGDAAAAARGAGCAAARRFRTAGAATSPVTARAAASSPSPWARWPSACRTCCSNLMAARCSA